MANKLDEKELNNVSGGCGGNKKNYIGTLYWYDSSNNLTQTTHTDSNTDIDKVRKDIKDFVASIFMVHPHIKRIDWVISEESEGEKEKGSKGR